MTTYRYKNTTEIDQHLIGFGLIEAGKSVVTEQEILNPNFERVMDTKADKKTVSKDDNDGSGN